MPRESRGGASNSSSTPVKQQNITQLRKKLGDREKHQSETSDSHRERLRQRENQRRQNNRASGERPEDLALNNWFIVAIGLIGFAFVLLLITKLLL
jgi:hypothetical protein